MKAILNIKSLSKKFGAIIANDNISFILKTNEIHAMIGPNGAGKSTLIKQIVGEIKQDKGEIRLCDKEISSLSTHERINLGLARTFQITDIVSHFSVLENTIMAIIGRNQESLSFFGSYKKKSSYIQEAEHFLVSTDLIQKRDVLAGYLSHGERRQLELCLALALKPMVILLDEPMAGLGVDTIEKMKQTFAKVKIQAPILLIEHNMNVVFSLADKISVLVYGKIIASGKPNEIKTNTEVRKAYLGMD